MVPEIAAHYNDRNALSRLQEMKVDFVFGTYSNDALKIANYRAGRTGIQHQNTITPVDPVPGEPVSVHIVTSGDTGITHAALYYTTDESTPEGRYGQAKNGAAVPFETVQVEWDSMTWDYVTHWQAIIPPQPDHTLVQYVISGWTNDGREMYADWPDAGEQVLHAAMIYFKNIAEDAVFTPHDPAVGRVFNYHVDTIKPPAWANDAVIYQVFIDRFYAGDGKRLQRSDNYDDVFGGTLWGVRDKLDYLADLGVNCIWLSPVWLTPSAHGYDVIDYQRIEPRIGGEAALQAVIDGAHQRGIRVLLDMACNHVSNQHPYFVDALKDESSLYRNWFFIGDEYEHGYRGFFNVASMPEVNLANPQARDWIIGHAQYWLREYDIDGYRLDYANGPGLNFWTYFRRACKAVKPDCLIFGEIIEPSSVLRQYVGRLDGCLDFPLNDAIRRTFGWQVWDTTQLQTFIDNHNAYFPSDFIMPTFVDNHDMDRFSHIAQNDNKRLKEAVKVQMQQDKPVIIYYGCEVGLVQPLSTRDHGLGVCRVPMIWENTQNQDLFDFYKQQIQRRKQRRVSPE